MKPNKISNKKIPEIMFSRGISQHHRVTPPVMAFKVLLCIKMHH